MYWVYYWSMLPISFSIISHFYDKDCTSEAAMRNMDEWIIGTDYYTSTKLKHSIFSYWVCYCFKLGVQQQDEEEHLLLTLFVILQYAYIQ